jgi:hypothetical protein
MPHHSARFSWLSLLIAGVVSSAAIVACSGEDADPAAPAAETGEEDELKNGKSCSVIDESGQGLKPSAILKHNDPVAKFILKGPGTCPKSFVEMQARLRKTDVGNCVDTKPEDAPANVKTRLVSERSQVLGEADSYRAVVTRTCNGRSENELFFSIFGIPGDPDALPVNAEVIGFDKTTGAYNFYAFEEGKWHFFGSSISGIAEGYGDCDADGVCALESRHKSRCWECHPGGGLVMKELNSPWVHWEGDTDTPGASQLITKFKSFLGQQSNGISLESTVASGNDLWNTKRAEIAKTKLSVADMLKPLFCTVELNIQSSTISTSSPPSSIRADFFFDPFWSKFGSFPFDTADYTALLESTGQMISSNGSTPLKDKSGKTLRDTVFGFSYVERAAADNSYVNKLKSNGVIDDDFIRDVLVIDFTRPIFSKNRCDLVQFAPELPAEKRDAASIRQGFIDNIKAKAPPAQSTAGQFLANLEKTGDSADHNKKLDDFAAACKARPKKELLADAFQIASLNRNLARKMPLFEFREALPFDKQNVAEGTFFDPVTCTLKK